MHGEFHATVISFVQEREQREESNRTRGQTKIGSLMTKRTNRLLPIPAQAAATAVMKTAVEYKVEIERRAGLAVEGFRGRRRNPGRRPQEFLR
jgi:hypothetical protein